MSSRQDRPRAAVLGYSGDHVSRGKWVFVRRVAVLAASACIAISVGAAGQAASAAPGSNPHRSKPVLSPGSIKNVMVIDLENEDYATTFLNTPGYLRDVLEPQGELLQNYYATGHVSLDNYIAQVSGQAPNYATNSDCVGSGGAGAFSDVQPGTLNPDQTTYPGQVDGQGCVYPASVQTIGDQLDTAHPNRKQPTWRVYAEDMGNDAARDGGQADPLGGTDCAHPVQTAGNGVDNSNSAEAADQYATRHNPGMYFHSIIDNTARCNSHVVPLGTVTVGTGGAPDTFSGHLAKDLAKPATTPMFSFISPNLCNDGHDSTCAGSNTEGGKTGGLTAANSWLSHWLPMILNSPAYLSGHMLVVITADEGNIIQSSAGDHETAGPGNANPGYSPLLNTPIPSFGGKTYYQVLGLNGLTANTPPTAGTMPGGGQIGALLLNPNYVHAGTVDSTGSYNHYSALRTYEDLLGIHTGGSDGQGHLGFASTATSFGSDVFSKPGS
jgi:hypothetical protein